MPPIELALEALSSREADILQRARHPATLLDRKNFTSRSGPANGPRMRLLSSNWGLLSRALQKSRSM